jgi:hypothetical protein
MVWIQVRGLKPYECRIAIIGEKFETGEVKRTLSGFFKNRDVQGAKDYFLKCYEKRPDILMEASDITGECKICLQAVSTANLELAQYGSSFLDRICEYSAVMRYFRGLNDIVVKCISADVEAEAVQWFRAQGVSDIALQAAIRIYAPDEIVRQNVYEKLAQYCL